jgi:ribulose-bisphosphate carboxylase large chain
MKYPYIDLKYKPGKNDLIACYTVNSSWPIKKAANAIAEESSIGTWTELTTMSKKIFKTLKPSVYEIKKSQIKIAYPVELFEQGNMPQILSSIAGNIFGLSSIKSLRLEDIHFPKKLIKSFKGPYFGIEGIRKLLKVKKRPLIGTIVKPKLGLNEKQHAEVAYQAWIGGCDIVKDDENLSSMSFNKFNKRINLTLKLKWKAEKETGEKKIYMSNITSETFEMIKRAEYVAEKGGEYLMIDILTSGFSALQTIRNLNFKKVIHAHRAGHAAITKEPNGISMLTIAKIARLIGVDQLHIGTAHIGKMEGSVKEVQNIEKEIEEMSIKGEGHILDQKWENIKPVFAVASGGLSPLSIPKLIRRMGTNIIIQMGGGIHWHPDGTKKGAMAARQALDATMQGISLKEYSKTHSELKDAIKRFGYKK